MNFKKSPLHVRANQLKENVKSIFSLEEGKLLGNIFSRDGVKIDPARVHAV